jgi:hypothetical protein
VVRISEVEKPAAKDNAALVKVHVTTVNRTDCGFRSGKPFFSRFFTGLVRPRGTVMGNEFAGEVEAVGSGVTSFGAGDRVFGFTEPFSSSDFAVCRAWMAWRAARARQGQQRSFAQDVLGLELGVGALAGSGQPCVARSVSCTALLSGNQYAHGMISGRRCDRGRERTASGR